jgi:hypothetical protein
MNKAIVDNKVVETKLEKEAAFKQFAQKVGNKEYETVVENINNAVNARSRKEYLMTLITEIISNVEFIQRNIYPINSDDTEKVRATAKAVYDWVHNRDYNHEVDRRVAKKVLPLYMSLTEESERPALLNEMSKKYKGDMEKYIDHVYDNSIISNKKNFDKYYKKGTEKSLAKDAATQLREAIYDKYAELAAEKAAFDSVINPLHKTYLKGLMEKADGAPMAPDANSTMRMTYGSVRSYLP